MWREKATEYYYDNKDEVLKKAKIYRDTKLDKHKQKEYIAKYYINNKAQLRTKSKEYAERNKEHLAKKAKEYHEKNKETIAEYQKRYREDNSKNMPLYKKAYREENIELVKMQNREWKQNNKSKVLAACRRRAIAKINRTVAWADLEEVEQVYADCEEINIAARLAGCTEKFVVDHIVPLQGVNVSGLHIASNLQIITAKANLEKSNKFTPGPNA